MATLPSFGKSILFASLLALATGCANKDLDGFNAGGKVVASIECQQTKATLGNIDPSGKNHLVWQAKDSISLFDGKSNIKCTLVSGEGDSRGVFTPESEPSESSTYYAVYPYSAEWKCKDGSLTVIVPAEVSYNPETGLAEGGINMMVGKESSTEISLKNLCSYIRFRITGTSGQIIKRLVIEGRDGQAVAGKAEVTFSDGEPVIAFDTENSVSQTVVNFGDGMALSPGGRTFTVAVSPAFKNGFKASIYLTDGTCQMLESDTGIGRNAIVDMPSVTFSANAAARIEDIAYSSLSEAFAAANAATRDVTITLLDNISASGSLTINNPNARITLDLGGCSLSLSNTLTVRSDAEIMDGKDGSGSINTGNAIAVSAEEGSLLTISGGTLSSTSSDKYTLRITNGGKAIISGDAHIISHNYRSIYLFGSENALTEATLEIRGGWIQCAENNTCVVTSRSSSTADNSRCFLNISGGHFSHSGKDYDKNRRCLFRGYNNCTTVVSGGFYDTDDIYRYYDGKPNNYTAVGCSISSTQTDYPMEHAAGYTYYVKRDGSRESIDKAIRKLFDETGAVNLTVLAFKGGKEVYSSTFGYRCAEPGNIDTLEMHDIFRIASISKSFTAGAMMLLVNDHRVDLDAPVNDYLSRLPKNQRFEVRNPSYPDVPITVRMLLNHTSTIEGSPYSGENCFQNISYSDKKPGTVYSYSNMGSCLAGAVVELASGERLDLFVKKNLLDRIGMPHSGYDASLIDTLHGPKFVHLYTASRTRYYTVKAYKKLLTEEQERNYILGYDTGLVSPAGNMKTNAYDLSRWMRTLQMGGLSPDGIRIIPEAMTYLMHNSTGAGSNYAFFLSRNNSAIPGVIRCGHTGSYYGAHTTMYYGMRASSGGDALPPIQGSADDWGIITLASGNNTDEGALGSSITNLLYYNLISGSDD